MLIQKRSLGWLPRASLYNEAKAATEKRRAGHASFIETQNAASSTFGSIQMNLVAETGNITSQVAAERLGINLKKSA